MNKTDAQYWDDVWEGFKIPAEYKPERIHEQHIIFKKFLPRGEKTLFEVGCAPGQWMAYFNRQFGYRVKGIEYADDAFDTTIKNFDLLDVKAELVKGDFFNFPTDSFDVVFSSGFIEHFDDPSIVLKQITSHVKKDGGIIITIVPSLFGINGWFSKVFRPHVYNTHVPISLNDLKQYHHDIGFKTLHTGYLGCFRPIYPMAKNSFTKNHPRLAKLFNLPFVLLNGLVFYLTRGLKKYPQVPWFARSLIYIGSINSTDS